MPNMTKSEAPKSDVWNKPASPETLRTLLSSTSAMDRIGKVIPKHMTPERMLNISLSIINAPAKGSMRLLDCTPMSLLQSIVNLSEVGLEPGGALGLAYLVPYRDPKGQRILAKAMIGYQGFIELAIRSGRIAKIESRPVFEKDDFNIEYGMHQDLKHKPYTKGDPGEAYVVYAIAHFTKEGTVPHYGHMLKSEIYKIRDRSESYKSALKYNNTNSPWITDEFEMWKKTIVRREQKYLPKSPEMARAAEIDEEDEVNPMVELNSRPFEVKSDSPAPPAPEPEDAEVVNPETGEVSSAPSADEKMKPPEGDDPFNALVRGILLAKDRDALDERISEAGRERKNMSDDDWTIVQRAIAQRKAELQ